MCAHGYPVLSDEALVAYVTDEEYDATLDAGIHWASAGIAWPSADPVVSDRDGAFEELCGLRIPVHARDRRRPGPVEPDPPMSDRVVVTGVTGFIGSHLARALVARGVEVHALTRPGATSTAIPDLLDAVTVHEDPGRRGTSSR